ncbi:hypothetical protein BGX23_007447 [Mortierella sp. AD031]|nr:hypothetical protein BGX23_007447 [Mortierella sp. AD031]
MADTTTVRPTRTTATRSATGTATGTRTSVRPTGSTGRTTTPGRATRTIATTGTITSTTATISPTATPAPSGGLGPGAIGGIAGGAVALVALVGLVFYKRRKRATVGASSKNKDEPIYMHASNYSSNNHKNPPKSGISGPLALSAESDVAAPSPFGRPSQQQQRPREDDHRGPPGAGPYSGPGDNRNNNFNQQDDNRNYHNGGRKSEHDDRYPSNNNNSNHNNSKQNHNPHDDKAPLQNDYYDDVQDYYDGPQEPIGAQRPVITPRDVTQGNLTSAPEYYLGKEDIDPRRDLRGLDEPETYIRRANMNNNNQAPVDEKGQQRARHRRSSVSSDGGSAYMTLDQAQQAHQKKMQGHKESIGSVNMLIDTANKNNQKPYRPEGPRSPGTPSFAHDNASIAISDSHMSTMPSLAPINSPMPYKNGGNNAASRPKGSGPLSPSSHDDPYAESAFSEDFSSYPSIPHQPGPYKGPHPSQQHPYPQHHSPYAQGPYGPGNGGGGYPQHGGNGYGPGPGQGYPGSPPYNGYGNGGGRPPRGPGGGYGPQSQGWSSGPGYGPQGHGGRGPNYGPQNGYNGYPPRDASPGPGPGGYRQHAPPQQRDPYYQHPY